jgi:mono/diheme cytochrome c family protein
MPASKTLAAMVLLMVGGILRAQEVPSGDAVQGKKQYMDFGCWQCHGTTGAGGGWQGPKLAPRPMPFAAFLFQLRTPRAQMPHYSVKALSDKEVAGIYAYLLAVPVGPPASQIELLKR